VPRKKISYNESASYSMKEIFMERFNRLSHSIWDCKYHVVWIPKYRRKELYGVKRQIVVDTIKQWARVIDLRQSRRLEKCEPLKAVG